MCRSGESASRDANQHLKAAVQCNLLAPTESRRAQATRTPNDGTDARALAACENTTKQRTGASVKDGVLNTLSSSPTRFDGPFDVYLFAGRCMIKLNDFGMNRRAAPVLHDQAVELQDHTGMAVDSAGHVNVDDVAVDPSAPVVALVNNGGAERVTYFGVGAGRVSSRRMRRATSSGTVSSELTQTAGKP